MTTIFAVPELTWHTASYLPSPDIAHLIECNRLLHGTLLPNLYSHVEFSIYKITPMHYALQANSSLAMHTRSLSITMAGRPSDDEKIAYRTNQYYCQDMGAHIQTRSQIRKKLTTIIREFSKGGKLKYFSWSRDRRTSEHSWILDFEKMWSSLSQSAKSLQQLDCHFCLGSEGSVSSIPMKNFAPRKPFEAIQLLSLSLSLKCNQDLKDLRKVILSFPNVKVVSFQYKPTFWVYTSDERQSISALVASSDGSLSLEDLTVSGSGSLEHFGPYDVLKGLNIARVKFDEILDPIFRKQLQRLAILRIPHCYDETQHTSLGELPNLACLEITIQGESNVPRSKDIFDGTAPFMLPNLVEFAVIVKVASRDYSNGSTIKSCTDVERLLNLVHACAVNCKLLRAIRLVYKSDGWSGRKEKPADLPDRITLSSSQVPSALEYVIWEVPWMLPKLFRVQRTDGVVDAVYTGRCRLRDRPCSKHGSWTDESVFDYMGLTGEGS